jgi:hypothetical protein
MPVKFNQYWNVIPNRTKDYEKFIIRDFIPGLNRLGIQIVAGWSVIIGAYSEIMLEGVSNDLDLLEQALKQSKYKKLNEDLLSHVKGYKTKILIPSGRADIYSMDFKEHTVKFTQMWDVIIEKKADYERFVSQKYYPLMEAAGINVAGEWEVFIGDGPHFICEARVSEYETLIENLQSREFRKAKTDLKKLIENYQSRLLAFHVQKVKGYKSASYNMINN